MITCKTLSIGIISQTVKSDYLSPQAQKHILTLLKLAAVETSSKPRGQWDSLSHYHFSYIPSIISDLCEQGSMDPELAPEFIKLINEINGKFKDEVKNNWYSSSFTNVIDEIKNVKSNPIKNFKEIINKYF
jgi:nicotinamidase-related amidase